MTKGASSHGKKSGKNVHIRCRRCGRASYHKINSICAHCGYGKTPRVRKYAWMKKLRH
ncbi:50S ribosomal protein L37e [Candidatus Woesearchaeota archaeon]|nr:50S ribosomal protein L37e [Candidatus Woesearchaeota archaeon]